VAEIDGRLWVSQPVAVRVGAGRAMIERIRTVDGRTEPDTIELALLDAPRLADEGRAAGFSVVPGERIAPTPDHVGSAVVLLRA
jgi:hypothetical protein